MLGTVLVSLVLLALVAAIIFSLVRGRKKGSPCASCGCGCASCGKSCGQRGGN